MQLDNRARLYLVLACAFVTSLVVGDLIAVKVTQVTLLGVVFPFTVGLIPFPVTFLLTDLLNEFYGKSAARQVTLVGLAMALLTLGFVVVGLALPWADMTRSEGWGGVTQAQFDPVLGGSFRIYFASLAAYLVAQFTDIAVFHALKRVTRNRLLWLRATGSTVASQVIDTVVVNLLAWYGRMENDALLKLMIISYAVKLGIALALTPAIYASHAVVERVLEIVPVKLGEGGEPETPPAPVPSPG
jgi:hypothetical protein